MLAACVPNALGFDVGTRKEMVAALFRLVPLHVLYLFLFGLFDHRLVVCISNALPGHGSNGQCTLRVHKVNETELKVREILRSIDVGSILDCLGYAQQKGCPETGTGTGKGSAPLQSA